MKKIGLIALALVTVTGVYAQKGVEDGSRYGHGQMLPFRTKRPDVRQHYVPEAEDRLPVALAERLKL